MAEKQQDHRHEMERKVVESGVRRSAQGLPSALAIGLAVVAAAVYVTYLGYPLLGGAFTVADLATLVGAFIYGSISQRNEREKTAQNSRSVADRGKPRE